MRQKFSIAKRLLLVSAALLVLGAGMARAADIALAPAVPDRYVVQKGDTLWGIAQKFLRDPWLWPDIWRLNREQIKNPHWIYPGDVIVLERGTAGAPPQLRLERDSVRLSPSIRSKPLDVAAIPSIPPGDLEPYLSWPLVTGPDGLLNVARIVAGRDSRVVRGEDAGGQPNGHRFPLEMWRTTVPPVVTLSPAPGVVPSAIPAGC